MRGPALALLAAGLGRAEPKPAPGVTRLDLNAPAVAPARPSVEDEARAAQLEAALAFERRLDDLERELATRHAERAAADDARVDALRQAVATPASAWRELWGWLLGGQGLIALLTATLAWFKHAHDRERWRHESSLAGLDARHRWRAAHLDRALDARLSPADRLLLLRLIGQTREDPGVAAWAVEEIKRVTESERLQLELADLQPRMEEKEQVHRALLERRARAGRPSGQEKELEKELDELRKREREVRAELQRVDPLGANLLRSRPSG
jgi:hypothetical protein